MKYENERSLCFNIAKAIGMSEEAMRTAVNATAYHRKNIAEVKDGYLCTHDVLVSDKSICIISVQAKDDYVDYMVASLDIDELIEMGFTVTNAINNGINEDWVASNAMYYNSSEYGHMAKVHALHSASEDMNGEMISPKGW